MVLVLNLTSLGVVGQVFTHWAILLTQDASFLKFQQDKLQRRSMIGSGGFVWQSQSQEMEPVIDNFQLETVCR